MLILTLLSLNNFSLVCKKKDKRPKILSGFGFRLRSFFVSKQVPMELRYNNAPDRLKRSEITGFSLAMFCDEKQEMVMRIA